MTSDIRPKVMKEFVTNEERKPTSLYGFKIDKKALNELPPNRKFCAIGNGKWEISWDVLQGVEAHLVKVEVAMTPIVEVAMANTKEQLDMVDLGLEHDIDCSRRICWSQPRFQYKVCEELSSFQV